MQDFFSAVSNFGFPVVVAAWLLFRMEGKLDKFGKKISKFSEVLEGKPSEKKPGLISVIQESNVETKKLTRQITELKRKIK